MAGGGEEEDLGEGQASWLVQPHHEQHGGEGSGEQHEDANGRQQDGYDELAVVAY
jgi:hypothetical protein